MYLSTKLMRRSFKLIVILTSLSLSSVLQAQWFSDLSSELVFNDNLSRSVDNGAEDTGLSADITAGYYWQTGDYTGLSIIGSAKKALWSSYSGLNNETIGLGLNLSHKFGIGEEVPVINFNLDYSHNTFNQNIRDTDTLSLGFSLNKRLSALLVNIGLAYENVAGDKLSKSLPSAGTGLIKTGRVWDYDAWMLRIGAELDISALSWLSADFTFRDGDIVSTGIVYTGNVAALASTYDPTFGPHAVSYRLNARTRSFSLDYNRAVFESSTWYLGLENHYSTASNGVDYQTRLLRSGFIHSF